MTEFLEVGAEPRPSRPRAGRRRRPAVRRLITALVLTCVAVAGVVVGRVVWDRGHTYTTADVQAALLAFRAPGSIGTLDPPQPGSGTGSNGSATNAAGCDVLVRQPTGLLDGGTWSPSEEEPASELLVARFSDPAAARVAMSTLVGLLDTCRGTTLADTWQIDADDQNVAERLLHRPLVWRLVGTADRPRDSANSQHSGTAEEPLADITVITSVYGNVVIRYATGEGDEAGLRHTPADFAARLRAVG